MKNIDLEKYGFKKAPTYDYLFNGVQNTCYTCGEGNILITRRYDGNMVFIFTTVLPQIDAFGCKHYNLQIIKNREDVTEEELVEFYSGCMILEQELQETAIMQFRNYSARRCFSISGPISVNYYEHLIKMHGTDDELALFKKNKTKIDKYPFVEII